MDWWIFLLFFGMGTFGFLAGIFWASSILNSRAAPLVAAATHFVRLVSDEERVKRGGAPQYSALDVEQALEALEASVDEYHNG